MGHHAQDRAADPIARGAAASGDTIAAIATPPGRGGIGVVRISGPAASSVATGILGARPRPRFAAYGTFRDAGGGTIDSGIALFFRAPRSFTGEDVLELHGHGGPVVLDLLLARTLELGARAARPGEFSERAFLNGKLDLAQAEAIADLIESSSAEAARAAQRSLEGAFSTRIHELVQHLVDLRSFVEAAIDFAEEELELLDTGQVHQRLGSIEAQLTETLVSARRGTLLREGAVVVIAGRPNVGKSSLLNRLAERDAAIVTAIPGTTRDLLREPIHIDGLPLYVIDTAGLHATQNEVERIGVDRAWGALRTADAALIVTEDERGWSVQEQSILEALPQRLAYLVVRNKIDLTGAAPTVRRAPHGCEVRLSAKSGAGIDLLRGELRRLVGYANPGGEGFSARRRHLDALERAAAALRSAHVQLRGRRASELLAEDLRAAQRALGEITGEVTTEELLGRIFSTFCIGK